MNNTWVVIGLGFAVSVGVVGTSGCALTSKADVVTVRYFSPEVVRPRLTGAEPASGLASNGAVDVRLGRVSSGPNLRERIAYRDAAFELGYYDEWRWTERPETFVRRELGRAMYEAHGFRRVLSGSAPTLEVEVIAFDDVRLPTGRAARVQLKVILFQDTGVLFEDTVTVERPVTAAKAKIEDVIAAMAEALDSASEQVAVRVGSELGKHRASATEKK